MGAEKNVENHIKDDLKTHGYWYTKIYANSHTKKGVPDVLSVINGQLVALEIKRPTGGKPSPVQLRNLKEIADNNGLGIVTNDPHIVEKVPAIQKEQTTENVYYLDIAKLLKDGAAQASPAVAAKVWHHPIDGQPTPKEPYSLVIK